MVFLQYQLDLDFNLKNLKSIFNLLMIISFLRHQLSKKLEFLLQWRRNFNETVFVRFFMH